MKMHSKVQLEKEEREKESRMVWVPVMCHMHMNG